MVQSKLKATILDHKYFILTLCITGFILRVLASWFFQFDQLPDFHSQYGPIAEGFAAGRGFDDMRPPGFFFFLVPFAYFFKGHYIFPALIGQAFVGVGLMLTLYYAARQLFKDERAGRIALLIATFYPWLIYYSTQLSHEHWTEFWLCLSMLMLVNSTPKKNLGYFFGTGLVLGFACWTRSQFLLYVTMAMPLLFFTKKIPWQKICIIFITVLLFVFSWATYNGLTNKVWSFTGGNSDPNLYLGLNERNLTGGGIWGRDAPSYAELRIIKAKLTPEDRATFYKRETQRFVKEHPDRVITLAFKKMWIFWRPYPTAEGYTNFLTILIVAGSFLPIFLGAFFTVKREYKNKDIYILLLYIAQLNAIHLVFPGSLVYRFPIEPLLIILASASFSRLWSSVSKSSAQ